MCRRILDAILLILLLAHMTAAAEEANEIDAIQLKTEGFAAPIIVSGDPQYRSVTSLEIAGSLQSGKGTVTLNVGGVTFNDFGDATTANTAIAQTVEVLFERQPLPEAEQGTEAIETRCLYQIKFIDGAFLNRMLLVISTNTSEPQRLVIKPQDAKKRTPVQVFDLHGTPLVQDTLPDAGHQQIQLAGVTRHHNTGLLHEVRIRGKLNGRVHLDLDQSPLEFEPFGDAVIAKPMASKSTLCLLVRQETPDPTSAGRVIYDLVTKEPLPRQYELVLSPTAVGPHRLIIRTDGQIQNVVALHDPGRQRVSRLRLQCAQISPSERAAIDELITRVGYSFDATIESKQITKLKINQAVELSNLDATIAKLPNLKRLDFTGASLGPAGLPSLKSLTHLESLRFDQTAISDAGLKTLAPLLNLRELYFYNCTGITDASMPHIGHLKNLKSLQLYREDLPQPDEPDIPRITDAGLRHLSGLTKLKELEIYGNTLTDKGLEHLKGLTEIQQLSISGDGITDSGLQHLKALKNLKHLNLTSPRVTNEGLTELTSALPGL